MEGGSCSTTRSANRDGDRKTRRCAHRQGRPPEPNNLNTRPERRQATNTWLRQLEQIPIIWTRSRHVSSSCDILHDSVPQIALRNVIRGARRIGFFTKASTALITE